MDGTTRVTLVSVLHPIAAAATDVIAHIGAARSDEEQPSLSAALGDLERLAAETARARTLLLKLADEG